MTFSYTTNVRAQAGVTLQKIKTNKLNQKQRLPRAFYHVCSFFHMPFLYVLSTCSFFHVPFLYVLSTCSFFHVPFLYVLSPCSFFHVPFLYVLSSCLFVTLFVFWRAFPIRFVYLFVCLFCKCLSYTFCLAVRFNCIKRAVFKPLIFPAYMYKHCNRHLSQVATFMKRPRPALCSEWFAFIVIFNLY